MWPKAMCQMLTSLEPSKSHFSSSSHTPSPGLPLSLLWHLLSICCSVLFPVYCSRNQLKSRYLMGVEQTTSLSDNIAAQVGASRVTSSNVVPHLPLQHFQSLKFFVLIIFLLLPVLLPHRWPRMEISLL